MRHRLLAVWGVLALAVALGSLAAAQVSPGAKPYSPPRMPDGHPDLQGTYDLATLTPLERPAGAKAVLTAEEAAKLEAGVAARTAAGARPISGDRQAPPKGGDGSTGAAGNVGGYNNFWLDPGSSYTIVNGERRTSLIVEPADGRVPALTPAARQRLDALRARPTSDTTQSNDPGLETAPGAYDDPERRPLGERCLLGFGSTSGPPALPNYFYNNLHKIVQTPSAIMILTEMVHDARIVRMNAQHLPPTIRKWMGDSVGRWDGDTLVVETTNFTDQTRFRGASQDLQPFELLQRSHGAAAETGSDVVAGQRQQRRHLSQAGGEPGLRERCVVRRQHRGVQRSRGCRADEQAGGELGSALGVEQVVDQCLLQDDPGVPGAVHRPGKPVGERGVGGVQDRVRGDHPGEPVRLGGQHAEPDRAAPVLGHQGDVVQVETGDQAVQPTDVPGDGVVGVVGRLVRAAEADQVGRDRAQAGVDQHRDDLPVQVGPGRLTVQEQHDRAVLRPLVQVVHPQRGQLLGYDLGVVRGERVARKVGELRIRGAGDVDHGGQCAAPDADLGLDR